MLLCRTWPLRGKAGKTTGYVLLPCFATHHANPSAKSLMPFSITLGHQFYLLSSEAFLLTLRANLFLRTIPFLRANPRVIARNKAIST
jgi:hypothetical protein